MASMCAKALGALLLVVMITLAGSASAFDFEDIVGIYDLVAGSDQREVERDFYDSPSSIRLYLLPDQTCITSDESEMWNWSLEGDRLTMTRRQRNNDGLVVERTKSFTIRYANDILTVIADEGEDALWSAGTTHFKRR